MKVHPVALTLFLAVPNLFGATTDEAQKAFYRAFYLESGLRSFDEAQQAYAHASTLAANEGNETMVTQALLGHARCLLALGDVAAAHRAFEEVLQRDPDQSEAKEALAKRVASSATDGVDPELRLRIQALVQKLGGAERENAANDLHKIGGLAVPFLGDGLRSRDVAVVERSAVLLFGIGTDAAADELIRALGDSEVLFPQLVVAGGKTAKGLPNVIARGSPIDRVIGVGLEHPLAGVRQAVAEWVLLGIAGKTSRAFERTNAILQRIASDEEPSIYRLVLDPSWVIRFDGAWSSPLVEVLMRRIREAGGSTSDAGVAVSVARELADSNPEFRPLIVEFVSHELPEVRTYSLQSVCRWAATGDPTVVFRQIVEVLRNEANPDVVAIAVNGLQKISSPWPDEVRAEVTDQIRRVIATDRPDLHAAMDLLKLSDVDDSVESLTPEQSGFIYGELSGASWLDAGQVESLRTKIERRFRPRGRTTLDSAEGQLANDRYCRFFRAANQQTRDEQGRVVLWSYATREDPACVDAFLAGTADSNRYVRSAAYSKLSKLESPPSPSQFSHLAEDLAAGSSGAFLLLENERSAEYEAPLWSFVQTLTGVDRAGVNHGEADDLLIRSVALYEEIGGENVKGRLRALLNGSGILFTKRIATRLFEIDGEAFASDLAAGRVVLDAPTVLMGIPTNHFNRIAQEIPAERLSSAWFRALKWGVNSEGVGELMRKGLRSGDVGTQIDALSIAEALATAEDLPGILELADRGSVDVRRMATKTIAIIQERMENRASVALFGPGGKVAALDRAREMTKSKDPKRRCGAALALGALGDASAVPVLLDLLDDSDPTVQDAAIDALRRLGASGG